ncbi:MAG TPA: beta-propeller fold lactonase family protein, partial [Turneriella sp.]|nr:beta-propeller fold lactonase family protein [Turneriella sp.]
MKRLSFALITVVAVFTGCKSYEDSFNRNLNSTGLYVANSASNTISMFAADPKSGILNDLGTVSAGTTPVHVAVNSAGTFAYVVNSGSDDVYVYAVDKETRKLTFKSSASAGDNPRMIALHATKNFAYVVNENDDTISGYTL